MKPIAHLFTTHLVSRTSIRNSFKKGISGSFAFFAWSVLAAAQLTVPEGFVAEKIYDVPNKEQGSWISLAADHKGHIYAGSEKHGLYRFKIPAPATTVTDVQPAFGFKAKQGAQGGDPHRGTSRSAEPRWMGAQTGAILHKGHAKGATPVCCGIGWPVVPYLPLMDVYVAWLHGR